MILQYVMSNWSCVEYFRIFQNWHLFEVLKNSRPIFFTFETQELHAFYQHHTTYVDKLWWWLVKKCDLYHGVYRPKNKQTDKQMESHTKNLNRIYMPIENFNFGM